MIKSMTGFGKGRVSFADGYIRVEIKTFNHKFFELNPKLPENLQPFDESIKKLIRQKIKRGKVYFWITYEQCNDNALNVIIDEKRLKRYYRLLTGVKKKFKLKDDITLTQLLSFPEVIALRPKKKSRTLLWRSAKQALNKSLISLIKMRQKEGRVLARDLRKRAKDIKQALGRIKSHLPQQITRYKHRLKSKLDNYLDNNSARAERLGAEVALFARNCDVSEELTRLEAHIDNFRSKLVSRKETGKVLDFIAQELHREINTIGAKSSDFKISKEVIFIKAEVDKIREQVQNIE